MNDSSKKWKARLLSSSLPLEYEVSKILSKHNFTTSFDFSYSRQEGETQKEFSIDIHATAFEPFTNPNKINATLTILSECKFREEGKIWAFLPDVNEPEYSDFILGNTVKCVDSFSMKRLNMNPIYDFENQFNYSSKGTEIGVSTGEVFDKDLRHGILQLKYGLPYSLKDNIEFQVFNHIENATPFFIAPILITNADLYIFNENLAIEVIKNTNTIEEIATKVPYIIFGSGPGPDFANHHKLIFKKFGKIKNDHNIELFERKQRSFRLKGIEVHNSPVREAEDLEKSSHYTLLKYYSQYFICTLENLDSLVKQLQESITKSLKRESSVKSSKNDTKMK